MYSLLYDICFFIQGMTVGFTCIKKQEEKLRIFFRSPTLATLLLFNGKMVQSSPAIPIRSYFFEIRCSSDLLWSFMIVGIRALLGITLPLFLLSGYIIFCAPAQKC